MNVIGNIKILSSMEIVERAKEIYSFSIKNKTISKFDKKNLKENLKRCISEPLPYKLFRLNELMDFNLNGVGCEITEEEYTDRIEQLPPTPFKNDILSGYIVPEPITHAATGVIYEHLFDYNNKCYCVVMETGFKVV